MGLSLVAAEAGGAAAAAAAAEVGASWWMDTLRPTLLQALLNMTVLLRNVVVRCQAGGATASLAFAALDAATALDPDAAYRPVNALPPVAGRRFLASSSHASFAARLATDSMLQHNASHVALHVAHSQRCLSMDKSHLQMYWTSTGHVSRLADTLVTASCRHDCRRTKGGW